MKKVTVTQLRYQTPTVVSILSEGKPLLITKRGKPFAVINPALKTADKICADVAK